MVEAEHTVMSFQHPGFVVVLIIGLVLTGCSTGPTLKATPVPTPSREGEMPTVDILKVMEDHQDELMAIPGVVGIGIGRSETTGEQLVVVLVEEMTPELRARLPTELEGFEVTPVVTGPIQAQ